MDLHEAGWRAQTHVADVEAQLYRELRAAEACFVAVLVLAALLALLALRRARRR